MMSSQVMRLCIEQCVTWQCDLSTA